MFEKLAELLNAECASSDDQKCETQLYVPVFEGKEKEYEVYDTVEKAFLTNLKANCVSFK